MSIRHTIKYLILFCLGCLINLPMQATIAPKKFTLVIDAGHGGKDTGAPGSFSKEKNINLNVAREFGRLVERNCSDVRVVYTRKTDVFVTLTGRADVANKAKADLFVSIHTNALERNTTARGSETYTLGMARAKENLAVAKRENSVILKEDNYKVRYQGFDPNSSESYIIFEVMQDKYMSQSVDFAKMIQRQFRNKGGRSDKGVHQAGFAVLRLTSMPSVLIELGYISTPAEERFLNSRDGISTMARCIYNAFLQYKQKRQGTAAVDDVPYDDASQNNYAYKDNESTPPPYNPPTQTYEIQGQPAQERTDYQPTEVPATPAQQPTVEGQNVAGLIVFKVQVLSSGSLLDMGNYRFKGLDVRECFQEGGLYKYTYGASTDYNVIYQTWRNVVGRFPDAFIVAFRDGVKLDIVQAVREYKQQNR